MLNKWKSYIRTQHWWAYKAAPILGFTYFYCYFFDFSFRNQLSIIICSAITIVGIAGIGYVINDIYDVEFDQRSGKKNPFINRSKSFISLVILTLLSIAIIPWIYLKSNIFIWAALVFQILLFIIYAHPSLRLKEKNIWGPICDALYGHVVPIIIACLTYQQYLHDIPYSKYWFWTSLFIWQFSKGLRNIFLHQLEDYENDIQSQIKTLTTVKGRNVIYKSILRWIMPIEVFSLLMFLGTLSSIIPWVLISLIVFVVINMLANGIFRNVIWDKNEYSPNPYIYFLNNYYEIYLPYFFLLICIIKSPIYLILLVFHTLFFPNSVSILFNDFRKAIKELWIQIKKMIYPLYKYYQNKDF